MRIILSLVISAVLSSPHYFIDEAVPETQLYFLLTVKHFLPSFLASFVMFAFSRLLFYKLNLVNENSVGRMFEINEEDGEFTGPNSKHGSNSLEFMEIEMS